MYQLKTHKVTELTNKLWRTNSSMAAEKVKRQRHSRQIAGCGRPRNAALKKRVTWLTIWFWVQKIRHRLTERSGKFTRNRHSI